MIQSLAVISVNLWNILISLANLLILFWIVKKFLFQPVKKVLEKRENEIKTQYDAASEAKSEAEESKAHWEKELSSAESQAKTILNDATKLASNRAEKIVEDAKERAEGIIRQANVDAELEYKKAQERIKEEIVSVSVPLAEKMLGREINAEDHRDLIDSFLEEIGD